jgi:hypothetical protein
MTATSRLLEDGGVTFFGRRLVISRGDRRDERELTDDDDLIAAPERWFDLRIARAEDRWVPRP